MRSLLTSAKPNYNNQLYEFGVFRADVGLRILWANDQETRIAPKVFDCLLLLVEREGHIISREEFMDRVWPDGGVTDNTLSFTISQLRKTLGRFDPDTVFVETISRRGFRFCPEVRIGEPVNNQLSEKGRSYPLTRRIREIEEVWIEEYEEAKYNPESLRLGWSSISPTIAVGVVAVIAAVFAVSWLSSRYLFPPGETKTVAVLPLKTFSKDRADIDLAARITDSLYTQIGSIPEINVASASAIEVYQGSDENPLTIGKDLGVDLVLEGRFQSESDRLRMTFQLISVIENKVVWTEKFDGKRNNLVSLQTIIRDRLMFVLRQRGLQVSRHFGGKDRKPLVGNSAGNSLFFTMLENGSVLEDPTFLTSPE